MVDGFFRKMAEAAFGSNNEEDQEVRPASQDPYGDPADVGMFGNVRPASEDPYGDPADAGMFGDQYANEPYTNTPDDVMYGSGEVSNEEYYEDDRNERRNSW